MLIYTQIGEGNGSPLQYSCLENPMDRGAWWAVVHGVAQSQTQLKWLSMLSCIGKGNGNSLQYFCLENSRGRWAWWGAVYGVAQSWTQLQRLSSSIHTNVYQRLFKNLIFIYKYLFHITITHIMPWNYDILYCKMKNNFKAVHKLWTHFCKNVHIHITELVSVKMCVCMYKQFRVV